MAERQKYLPAFIILDEDILFDDSVWKTNLIRKDPTSGKEASALNGGSSITFELESSSILRLSSPRSGIEIEYEFRTKSRQGQQMLNDQNANVTLANGAIWYLFERAKLRFGDEDVESINNLPIVIDIMNQLKDTNFRRFYGEGVGFIPDEEDGQAAITPGTVTISEADTSANANAGRPVAFNLNNNYNFGYRRRYLKYNYPVENDDVFRTNREFHPFSEIFGFCSYYDKLMKHMRFMIELVRSNKDKNAILGVPNTDIEIRITNIVFQVEEVILDDQLKMILNKRFAQTPEKPLLVSFLRRKCESKRCDTEDCDFSFTKFSCPRFVFVAAKKAIISGQSDVDFNYSLYCHADIKEVIVTIDDKQYPDCPQNTKFSKNQYSAMYQSFIDICRASGGDCSITARQFKELFPICAVDCSNQPPKLLGSVTNLGISIKRNPLPIDDTNRMNPRVVTFYVLILDEAMYSFDVINQQVKRLRGGLASDR